MTALSKLLGAFRRSGGRSPSAPPGDDTAVASLGRAYDRTRRADPRILASLSDHLDLDPPGRILDLGCGTGNYAVGLAESGFRVTGLDSSLGMLAAAAGKTPSLPFCRGDARDLPFRDGSFDGAVCVSALHQFDDLEAVLRETGRVLASGRLVVFTALRQQLRGYWLNRYFPTAMERAIEQIPDQNAIEAAFAAAGFDLEAIEPWEVPEKPVDLFLYAGKHVPGLYLDRRVRSGISTFSALAAPEETFKGVKRLTVDIGSGRIKQIIAEHEHDLGDYSFLIAAKRGGGV